MTEQSSDVVLFPPSSTSGSIGQTHLDYLYDWGGKQRYLCPAAKRTARRRTWTDLEPGGSLLGIDTRNPITPQMLTPPINEELYLQGGLGELDMTYFADAFPSAGIEVARDGHIVAKIIVNDASCVSPILGPLGAVELGRGLTTHISVGEIQIVGNYILWHRTTDAGVPIGDPIRIGPHAVAPSPLCTNGHYKGF